MKESKFQSDLKKELQGMFPGCMITKLDSGDIQGIPDLLVLYKDKWAVLENKRSAKASHQPNQDYYIDKANANKGFGRFVYPENEESVIKDMKDYFGK